MNTPPPIPTQPSQPPRIPGHLAFEPMPEGRSPILVLEALLKYPGKIIHELQNNWRAPLAIWLLILALLGTATYGVVVGSFSGGTQMWIAPARLGPGRLLWGCILSPCLLIF